MSTRRVNPTRTGELLGALRSRAGAGAGGPVRPEPGEGTGISYRPQPGDRAARERLQLILDTFDRCRLRYAPGAREGQVVPLVIPEQIDITPQHEKYLLTVEPRILGQALGMGRRLAMALGVAEVAVEVEGPYVVARVPRREGARGLVTFAEAWRAAREDLAPGRLLLGLNERGAPLVLDMTSPANVHAACVGMSGSGKSTLMRTMILAALQSGAPVAVFDPSGGFRALSGHPRIWHGGLFQDAGDGERGLALLARAIGKRDYGLLLVFVDEVPELIARRPAIREHLARLAQAGRHAGVHLILGAQHPLASELGPVTMRNIPVRLVGAVADKSAAAVATGREGSGAEKLRGGGDFIAVTREGATHFQAARIPDTTLRALERRYPPREPRVPVQAPSAQGEAGRPPDGIDSIVRRRIAAYAQANGRAPSLRWVERVSRELIGAGYNRAKAARAISAAIGEEDGA